MKLAIDLPEYQNIHMEIAFTFWTNKPTVWINGNPTSHIKENSRTFIIPMPNYTEKKLEFRGFTLDYQPRIFIDGKFISIVRKLKWYEILLSSLPVVMIFFGGAIGGLCAFVGVTTNFKIFRIDRDIWSKLLMVLGINIASFLVYMIINWLTLFLLKKI